MRFLFACSSFLTLCEVGGTSAGIAVESGKRFLPQVINCLETGTNTFAKCIGHTDRNLEGIKPDPDWPAEIGEIMACLNQKGFSLFTAIPPNKVDEYRSCVYRSDRYKAQNSGKELTINLRDGSTANNLLCGLTLRNLKWEDRTLDQIGVSPCLKRFYKDGFHRKNFKGKWENVTGMRNGKKDGLTSYNCYYEDPEQRKVVNGKEVRTETLFADYNGPVPKTTTFFGLFRRDLIPNRVCRLIAAKYLDVQSILAKKPPT
jgi:hypothetical protein